MRDKKYLIIILPFILSLLWFFLLSATKEDDLVSKEEARKLMQKDEINFTDLKDLSGDIEDYLVDQFPYREEFVRAYSKKNKFLKKEFSRDVYISKDNWLFAKDYETKIREMKDVIEDLARRYPDKAIYYSPVPTKHLYMEEEYSFVDNNPSRKNLESLRQAFFQEKYKNLYFVDILKALGNKGLTNDKSKQFRTDFHWNALGAKDGVDVILASMVDHGDIEKIAPDSAYEVEYLDGRYLGDLNRRFSYIYGQEDQVMVIKSKNEKDLAYYMSEDESRPGKREDLISPGKYADELDYSGVYTENYAYYRVLNPKAANKKSIMIIKDSFQNPTTDIFSENFQEVKIIDPRFSQGASFDQAVQSADIVLIMLNQNNNSQEAKDYFKSR